MAENVKPGETGDQVVYECDCFRVLRYSDQEGQANISLSLYNHGIDVYMTEDEFGHLVEVLGGLEHIYLRDAIHH